MINREIQGKTVESYNTITLMAIDPRNPSAGIQELYPSTRIEGVFMDKELDVPYIEIFNEMEASKEEVAKLRKKTLANAVITLDEHGYVPLEYMDKKYLMLYNEFDNNADMLARCDYDPVDDHGRLVMVNDNTDDPIGDINRDIPHWAIFRLTGDNVHSRDSWTKVWQGIHNEIDYNFERIPNGVRSTALMVDNMVRAAHAHTDKTAIDGFGMDDEGKLTWNGRRVTMRNSFRAHFVIRQVEQLLEGDVGVLITSTDPYGKYNNTYVYICPEDSTSMFENYGRDIAPRVNTSATRNFTKFFMNANKLTEIPWMYTGVAEIFDDFCNGCVKLESISTLDLSNVKSAQRAFACCPNLKALNNIDFHDCTDMTELCKDSGIVTVGTITGNHIQQAFSAFEGCRNLVACTGVDLSNVANWLRMFKNCESIEMIQVDSSSMEVAYETFYGCKNLKTIEELDMTNCEETTNMFYGCESLEYVKIKEGTLTESISFEGTNLSVECGEEILANLPTITSNKIIIFTNSPASKVSGVLIALAEEKGWTVYR